MKYIADQLRPISRAYDEAATKRAVVIADEAYFDEGYRVAYRDEEIDVTPEDMDALNVSGHARELIDAPPVVEAGVRDEIVAA